MIRHPALTRSPSQSFSHKALTSKVVSDGIDKLDLAATSPATKTILDAAKAWHSFA